MLYREVLSVACLAGVVWACAPGAAALFVGPPASPRPVVAAQDDPDPVSLEGWPAETFALPPGFAPELPKGAESLRFAPGWRDPHSEEFWSYVFVMSIDEAAPDAARIDELLEAYYTGLMSAFGVGADAGDHVQAEVVGTGPGRYEAKMRLIDAFATFEPIELRVLIETVADTDEHSFVRIQISRQAEGHKIWRSLKAALDSIEFHDDALHGEEDAEGSALLDMLRERSEYPTLRTRPNDRFVHR